MAILQLPGVRASTPHLLRSLTISNPPLIEVALRIVVVHPPPGVLFGVQLGPAGLCAPTRWTPDALYFDIVIGHDPGTPDSPLRLRGPAVQGPPAGRFLYVNSGVPAGQLDSCWERRAKITLRGITWALLAEQRAEPRSVLEVRIEGRNRDGGPCCGSVPPLGAG